MWPLWLLRFWVNFSSHLSSTLLFLPAWIKGMGMAEIVYFGWFLTNTAFRLHLLLNRDQPKEVATFFTKPFSPITLLQPYGQMKPKPSVLWWSRMAWRGWRNEYSCYSLPWTWESNRILMAVSKRQPHAWDFKKLKYIVKSTHPGWSHACQETKSQKPPLDPSDHLSCNPSYKFSLKKSVVLFGLAIQRVHMLLMTSMLV